MKAAEKALKKIIRLIEEWADNHKQDHNSVLLKILQTALTAINRSKKK